MADAAKRANPAVDLHNLWPRVLYVYARVPAFRLPILIFVPTIVVEGIASLVLHLVSKDKRPEERAVLLKTLEGIRLVRQMGRIMLVDVEVKDVARLAQTDNRWLSGAIKVKIGQW